MVIRSAIQAILLLLTQQTQEEFWNSYNKPMPSILEVRFVKGFQSPLKPCQLATAMLEMTASEPANRFQWQKAARRLSNVVLVNGVEYRNRLSEGTLNSACKFELLGNVPPMETDERAIIGITCQVDMVRKQCLLMEPGEYEFGFTYDDKSLTILLHLDAPTLEERAIVRALNSVPVLLFLMDPLHNAPPENIEELEAMSRIPSDYSEMLALTIGIAKGRRFGMPSLQEMSVEERRTELWERHALLDPVFTMELDSRLRGLAAYALADVNKQLAFWETDAQKKAGHLEARDRLLRKVAECIHVPREQASAKEALQSRDAYPE